MKISIRFTRPSSAPATTTVTAKFWDVALRDDKGELLAAAFYTTESGEFETCLMRLDLTAEDSYTTLTYTGELPWKAVYRDDGGFWLLTNKALRSFAADGSLLFEERYGTRTGAKI